MEGKTLRKGKFYDENGKCHEKGQQAVLDQSMTTEKRGVMTKDRIDKEHEEQEEIKEHKFSLLQKYNKNVHKIKNVERVLFMKNRKEKVLIYIYEYHYIIVRLKGSLV